MQIQAYNQDLFQYIKSSPTAFHAIEAAGKYLDTEGFTRLSEHDTWDLQPNGKYYVTRNQSSLFAFRMPADFSKKPFPFQLVASHSDSPCYKLKDNCEISVEGHYTKLNVEKYGGSLMAPWFDRPLSIAGRDIVKDEKGISSRLVHFNRDLAMIVNLAIHMNRGVNDGYKYQAQTDMLPLIGSGEKDFSIKELVANELGVSAEQILTTDLYLYNRMEGKVWGANEEFISSPKLDDLECAYASIRAIAENAHPEVITGAVIFDSEEVGSHSQQGACSTFMKDCLKRISHALGYTHEEYIQSIAKGFLLSADNGHALHPNHTGKSDPTNHPYLNGGVLVKYSANQRYTSDGVTSGVFRLLCEQNDIPVQVFFNHSDVLGGSTLGNLSMLQVSIPTVDIGVAILGMHSPYETGGMKDGYALYQAMSAFYRTKINCVGESAYELEM